jgi:hypothetical protein
MDKSFSARLDVKVIDELEGACRVLRVTKKRFLEEAILQRVRQVAQETAPGEPGIWKKTCGLWNRRESAQATAKRIRKIVEGDFHRHHKGRKPVSRLSATGNH